MIYVPTYLNMYNLFSKLRIDSNVKLQTQIIIMCEHENSLCTDKFKLDISITNRTSTVQAILLVRALNIMETHSLTCSRTIGAIFFWVI